MFLFTCSEAAVCSDRKFKPRRFLVLHDCDVGKKVLKNSRETFPYCSTHSNNSVCKLLYRWVNFYRYLKRQLSALGITRPCLVLSSSMATAHEKGPRLSLRAVSTGPGESCCILPLWGWRGERSENYGNPDLPRRAKRGVGDSFENAFF